MLLHGKQDLKMTFASGIDHSRYAPRSLLRALVCTAAVLLTPAALAQPLSAVSRSRAAEIPIAIGEATGSSVTASSATPSSELIASFELIASSELIEAFQERGGISSVVCITACNEFFEAGQADFELEIQRLQQRTTRTQSDRDLFEIDSSLTQDLAPGLTREIEEQNEAELDQAF